MEKRLRSSLQTSPESFLSSATKLPPKSAKPTLRSLIQSINPSSELCVSLPPSLHKAISLSIASFKESPSAAPPTPPSPPTKRPRRSSRNAAHQEHQRSAELNREEEGKKCVLHKLQIYAYVALICATHPKRAFSPQDLFPSVAELHDNLILFESDLNLLSDISSLCEKWWKEDLFGREALITQFVPFLISRTLTLKKKADVHRVFLIKEALPLFDFDDQSIEDLKLLLVRCVISPLYLKTDYGRRFIAFAFGLSLQLLKELLAMIKSQILLARKPTLEAYGDIVFRGWKTVVATDLKTEIEEGFLQCLIEGAIYASSATFSAAIRRVLGGFINQRTTDGVEDLLFRLAEPIIYRSLQVANSNVRQNALHLLLDLFPLDDPNATKEVKDTLLDKQVFLLEKLLLDDCPDIRVVAVEGCCRILHLFWEVIPSPVITKMLTRTFDDLSHDASSEVRLSVLNGIIYLLGNPHSHEVLKVLLPRLRHAILDPILHIRVTAIDLLLLLRDIRGFHFYKVVDLDLLLTTLANDDKLVARKIIRLLMPSYFSSNLSVGEACNRYLSLVRRSPKAGARFCEFAHTEGASSQSLMELVKVLLKILLSSGSLNAEQIDGMLSAMSFLCESLASESSCKDALRQLFSGESLKDLLSVAATGYALYSLFNIVYVVRPTGVGRFIEECTSLVTTCGNLSDDTDKQAQVRSAHKLVLSCERFDDVFEAMVKSLQNAACGFDNFFREMPRHIAPSTSRKKTKLTKTSQRKITKRSFTFKDDYQIASGIAWQIKDLLSSEVGQKAILGSECLETAYHSLKVISEISICHCLCYDFMEVSPVEAYASLSLHATVQNIMINDIPSQNTNKNAVTGSSKSPSKPTVLDQTIDHLLYCLEPFFKADGSTNSGSLPTLCELCPGMEKCNFRGRQVDADLGGGDDSGSGCKHGKRLSNLVILLTAVLRLVTDATAVDILFYNPGRCLGIASTFVQTVASFSKQYFSRQNQFELEEMYGCLKCSFSYGAKLLNLVLMKSTEGTLAPPEELHDLASDLLDFMASLELHCGSVYATRIVTLAKQWLPDLILALGSKLMIRKAHDMFGYHKVHFRFWISVLAKIELSELRDSSSSDGEQGDKAGVGDMFPAFKKLSNMLIPLLTTNVNLLDSVGIFFLSSAMIGLQSKEFGLVLGLLHYVFGKLIGGERTSLEKLDMIVSFVPELYSRIEREAGELMNGENLSPDIIKARALLGPAWEYACQSGGMS